jgi:hypothetical protein
MLFQIEYLINESLKKLIKIPWTNWLWIYKRIIFIWKNIHAKVFLYIYENKIWIVKQAIILINYW